MSETQNTSKTNFAFQRNVAIVGILLFVGKLIAWHLTNSDAVFSDAMESIVNIIAAFMGLYSLYLAAKPKDLDHPYGHGKVEFVTSGIEGALIIFAGVIIIVQSVDSLLHGNVPKKLDWGILIVALTGAINYLMGHISVSYTHLDVYKRQVRDYSVSSYGAAILSRAGALSPDPSFTMLRDGAELIKAPYRPGSSTATTWSAMLGFKYSF